MVKTETLYRLANFIIA